MAVHRALGCGFLEPVYTHALCIELRRRDVPFVHEVMLPLSYAGVRLPLNYRVDFSCYDSVLVEVKALAAIGAVEQAQMINYSKASDRRRGLILDFGGRSLAVGRVVWGSDDREADVTSV